MRFYLLVPVKYRPFVFHQETASSYEMLFFTGECLLDPNIQYVCLQVALLI